MMQQPYWLRICQWAAACKVGPRGVIRTKSRHACQQGRARGAKVGRLLKHTDTGFERHQGAYGGQTGKAACYLAEGHVHMSGVHVHRRHLCSQEQQITAERYGSNWQRHRKSGTLTHELTCMLSRLGMGAVAGCGEISGHPVQVRATGGLRPRQQRQASSALPTPATLCRTRSWPGC